MHPVRPHAAPPRGPALSARALPWLVLAVSAGAGLLLWRTSALETRRRALDALASRGDGVVDQVVERIQADRDIVLGGVGLFAALGDPSPEAWHRYVAALAVGERYGGILGVGFARWIPPEALADHVRTTRAAGRPGYRVWPAGDRAGYSSITMLEPPSARNAGMIGFDMYAEPVRRAAMDRARDGGTAVLSPRVILTLEPEAGQQPGVLFYAPVYRPGAPVHDAGSRRAALVGWAFSALRLGDLVEGSVGAPPTDLAFTITEADTGALLHASHPSPAAAPSALRYVRDVDVLGRRWSFSFVAGPGFAARAAAERTGLLLALAVAALLTLGAFVLQRRAEEQAAVQEAERRRILFDASPDGMVLLDPVTARIVEFNRAAHTQLGYTREEFARLSVSDIEAAETPEQVRQHAEDVVRSGRGDFETVQRAKDGSLRHVHVTAQTVDVMGQLVYQAVWRDVTERRGVEAQLRDAHRQLRQIGDSLPGGFVFRTERDRDGVMRYTYVSAGVEALLGVKPEEILRDRLALSGGTTEAHRARVAETARRAAENGTPFTLEMPMRSRDGAELWVQVSAAPTPLPEGGYRFDGVTLDITDRKRAEADRLVRSKLESTGLLAGGIAHDFNNLLTTMLLGIELAREEATTEASRGALDRATEAIAAAQALTRQLITFARGGKPIRTRADVERLVREATGFALTGSPVSGRLTAAPGLWPADLDEGQVAQVVRNLVLNAREAMPQGGTVSLSLRNVTRTADDGPDPGPGRFVELTVADEGPGIPADVLPRIFDPYFSTKERGAEKGTGLGLTICHSVVKKHGGAISATSEPGHGATFRVLLPASREPAAVPAGATAAPGAAPRAQPAAGRRGKVLVMDDEAAVRRMLGAALRQLGCAVVETASGEEAVEAWGEARDDGAPFDLLLLDLTVRNGMGGVETMRLLRQIDARTPAVLMSGYAEDDALEEPGQHGFDVALRKPFDAEQLRAVVGRYVQAA